MFVKITAIVVLVMIGGIVVYVNFLQRKLAMALEALDQERTRQRSLSASYGRITEQWFPLMNKYPYDSANFRFLGTPIDGVQFEEDAIVFVEFKANRSELSTSQRKFRSMIEKGKVRWEEYHFEDLT